MKCNKKDTFYLTPCIFIYQGRTVQDTKTSNSVFAKLCQVKMQYNKVFHCECGTNHRLSRAHQSAIIDHLIFKCPKFVLQNPFAYIIEHMGKGNSLYTFKPFHDSEYT